MLSLLFGLAASKSHHHRSNRYSRIDYLEANGCTGVVVPSSGVYVRSGPSTSNSIVTSCSCGASVTVNGRSGDWYSVNANGVNGYIRGDLLKVPGRVNSNVGLNVRSGPGTNYGRVGGLSDGTSITITNIQNGWYQISQGWVCADYVELSGSSSGGGGVTPSPSGTVIRQGDSRFNSNIRKWGCAFMSCCWCGGVNSIDGCNALYNTAVNNGWMKSTCYINNWGLMATGVGKAKSCQWGAASTPRPSGAKEILYCENSQTSSHFVVGNGNGGIEYDPSYDGRVAYGDCKSKRFFYY